MNEPILPSPDEQTATPAADLVWQCQQCGERLPRQSDACWKCGTAHPDLLAVYDMQVGLDVEPIDRPYPLHLFRYVWLACIGALAMANFLIMLAIDYARPSLVMELLVMAWLGSVGAQAALHSVWCVLAPVSLAKKAIVAFVVAWLWFSAWALGFAVITSLDYGHGEVILTTLLCLPLLLAGVQLPIWVISVVLHWRIAQPANGDRHAVVKPLQIRHIILGTGIVGLALTAARAARPDSYSSDAEFLIPLLIATISCAAVSLLTAVPTTYATLRASHPLVGLVVTLVLDVFVVVVFTVIASIMNGAFPPLSVRIVTGLAAVILGFQVPLAGFLLIARRQGYRLSSSRTERAET